jgi:hypothetical protein
MNTSIGSLSRRTFLRRLSAVPFGLFGIRLPLKVEPEPRQTVVGRYYVAGFQYYRGPELIGRIHPGEAVCLAAEPENPHDPMAVRVDHGGEKLGYIPSSGEPGDQSTSARGCPDRRQGGRGQA